jgi:hypothetical protein
VNNTAHDANTQVRKIKRPRAKDNEREMSQPSVLPGADDVLNPGVDAVGSVAVGPLAPPASRVSGEIRGPERVAPAVGCLEQESCAPGWGRSRRAKTRIVFGQAFSWSPSGPSRSSPVSSVTCASSIQQAGWAQRVFPQASSERRSRTWPFKTARPPGSIHVESAPRTGSDKGFDTLYHPSSGALSMTAVPDSPE